MPTPGDGPGLSIRALCADAEATLSDAGVDDARRESALLAAWALDIPLARYYAVLSEPFPEPHLPAFRAAVRRRALREPFAYITGTCGFHGYEFSIRQGVLVPRPETELLVDTALRKSDSVEAGRLEFLDLCTGSGCVAISLALGIETRGKRAHGAATDISEIALRCARGNARRLVPRTDLVFLLADLFPPAVRRFDLIVGNPPYIESDGITPLAPEITRYEPREALDGGPDGLDFHRRIVQGAPRYLKPSGWLLLEHGYDQGDALRDLLSEDGHYEEIDTQTDMSGLPRVTCARRTKNG